MKYVIDGLPQPKDIFAAPGKVDMAVRLLHRLLVLELLVRELEPGNADAFMTWLQRHGALEQFMGMKLVLDTARLDGWDTGWFLERGDVAAWMRHWSGPILMTA